MKTRLRGRIFMAVVVFTAGACFQKWVGIGSLTSWISSENPKIERINPGDLKDDTTFCILALGQSNAANHGKPRARAGAGIHAFSDGSFYRANDPLPGASGIGGSVWTRLGPRLKAKPGNKTVVIACVAQGSSPASSWVPEGDHFGRLKTAINGLGTAGLRIDLVVWHQGETESWTDDADGSAYVASLKSVIDGIRQMGVAAPILVCKTSRDGQGAVNETIRLAQASVIDPDASIYPGPDTDDFGAECRHDGVHWNGQGLDAFASALEQSIDRLPFFATPESSHD